MIRDGRLLNIIFRTLATVGGIVMAVALLSLLAGCAAIDAAYDKSRWQKDNMATATYTWTQTEDRSKCGHYTNARILGCAVRVINAIRPENAKPVPGTTVLDGHCYIWSVVPEEEAKHHGTADGDNLFDHEIRHCLGWIHPPRGSK